MISASEHSAHSSSSSSGCCTHSGATGTHITGTGTGAHTGATSTGTGTHTGAHCAHTDTLRQLEDVIASEHAIHSDFFTRAAYAPDASHYLLTPEAVLTPTNAQEVGSIMAAARRNNIPFTLRSGGSSLCGQASTSGWLIDVRKNFTTVEVLDNGQRVRVQPGVTIGVVNAYLAPYGRKLGPDPASERACTIGGMIANNSSGMACGTQLNTYKTLESLVFVLPSGTVIDTGAPDCDQRFRELEPELFEELLRLQKRVRENPESVSIIEKHFALKNTMGYGLNSFLDYDSPSELMAHLLVGSEGTLAFVAEATLRTVPVSRLTTTTVAVFPSLVDATRSLPALVESGAATLELMDAASILVGRGLEKAPESIMGFEVDTQAALLIEYYADSEEELQEKTKRGNELLSSFELQSPVTLGTSAEKRERAWEFRKGLYTAVAGYRKAGTTALLEDVVVPVEHLADTCANLTELFRSHKYSDAVTFGHAKDGNIHFMITDRFEGDEALGRYHSFNEGLADLILGAGGNLKAEHGTGRAMAPYVRRQYGDELYDVVWKLKRAADPALVMNPGVILTEDEDAHMKSLKLPETVDEETNRCVECGYCEPVCPARGLTLTPRQRIVIRRRISQERGRGHDDLAQELEKGYEYQGIQTCAVDGMCQTACPMGINTGDLVRRLRSENNSPALSKAWEIAAKNWGAGSQLGSVALSGAYLLPKKLVGMVTEAARALGDKDRIPHYGGALPRGGKNRRRLVGRVGSPTGPIKAIYLPSCMNAMFGPAEKDGLGATDALIECAKRAGVALYVPEGAQSLCCGTPWSSKGMASGKEVMRTRVTELMESLGYMCNLPVVSDGASCSEGFQALIESMHEGEGENSEDKPGFVVMDGVEFALKELLPRLKVTHPVESLTLHPTCSSTRMGINPALRSLADAVATTVSVPVHAGCCAYAGDRGMLHPELTASATAAEAADVAEINSQAHASVNRTCEIGMSTATGKTYKHIVELLEEVTR